MKNPTHLIRAVLLAGVAAMMLPAVLSEAQQVQPSNWDGFVTPGQTRENAPTAVAIGQGAQANGRDGVAIGLNA